mmetsp:Transcript_798/g.1285  ORF Transcript_798/g.1285 Transcript_798/m.1285 type:complete len:90 (-) Transcript_798:1471-1740(-)
MRSLDNISLRYSPDALAVTNAQLLAVAVLGASDQDAEALEISRKCGESFKKHYGEQCDQVQMIQKLEDASTHGERQDFHALCLEIALSL